MDEIYATTNNWKQYAKTVDLPNTKREAISNTFIKI